MPTLCWPLNLKGEQTMTILRIVLFLTLALPAVAQAEFEASLYGGGSFTNSADATLDAPGANLRFIGVGFNSSGTLGGKVGYWFKELPNLNASYGIGLDVFSFSANLDRQTVPATLNGASGTGTFSAIDIGVLGIGLDLVKFRLHLNKDDQFPNGRVQPYATLGPAIFRTSVKDSGNNFAPGGQKDTSTSLGVKLGLGLQYYLTKDVGLFGEYRFTHAGAEGSFVDTGVPGTLKTDLNTHHLVFGGSFHF
jgi:opacity protein-like surface antigen